MTNRDDKPRVDPAIVKREFDGCEVQLFFNLQRNEAVERIVLDNLMRVFDRKMQGLSSVLT